MKNKLLKKGNYAFTGYDNYPYIVGGKIIGIHDGKSTVFPGTIDKHWVGRVELQGYGKGYWFQPKLILPPEEGKALLEDLNHLAGMKRAEERKLHNSYLACLKLRLPAKLHAELPRRRPEPKC